jgi:hypothetical protein
MKFGDETAKTVYNFPVDLEDHEYISLFEYARNHISEEDFERIMIEWAMVDLIKTALKESGFIEKPD